MAKYISSDWSFTAHFESLLGGAESARGLILQVDLRLNLCGEPPITSVAGLESWQREAAPGEFLPADDHADCKLRKQPEKQCRLTAEGSLPAVGLRRTSTRRSTTGLRQLHPTLHKTGHMSSVNRVVVIGDSAKAPVS